MGYTVRHYLFPEGASPLRLPKELVERLSRAEDFLPDYAGTRQKVLEIVVDNVDGKPDQIVANRGAIWLFDKDGGIAESLQKSLAAAMDTWWQNEASSGGKVVDLQPKIRRKQYEEEHHWVVGEDDLAVVVSDIFAKSRSGTLKAAKGSAVKPPPLTHEGKRALSLLNEPFYRIQDALSDLKEPALAGLAFQARRLSGEFDHPILHKAVAEMADELLEIARRRRRGDGTWYAYVEIMQWTTSDYAGRVGTTVDTYHVKCAGKKAAVAAARSLLAEHASRFAEDVTVEAFVETDIEWDAAGRMSTEQT